MVQLSLVFLGIEFIQKAKQTQVFEQKAQNEITITFWTTQPNQTKPNLVQVGIRIRWSDSQAGNPSSDPTNS